MTGALEDGRTGEPVAYANVVLFDAGDSSQVGGTASNTEGVFEILRVRPGSYYLKVFFVGFEIRTVSDVIVRAPELRADVGTLRLVSTVMRSDEIEVTADRLPLTYQLDKKVINVAEYQTAISGSAVEILEKVPSVSVDVDGNVSLRGSGSFTVLIDGRPTVLDPSDALQQIPAGTIETIEIITNPSAKFNPDGTAGIINVVLKKNQQSGRSGVVNVNSGGRDQYGADGLIEQKNGRVAVNLGGDYSRRTFDGSDKERFITDQNGVTTSIFSNGDSERRRYAYGVRGGLDVKLGPRDRVSLSGRGGYGRFGGGSRLEYSETISTIPGSNQYTSDSDRRHGGGFFSTAASYTHFFAPRDHRWNVDITYNRRNGERVVTGELYGLDEILSVGQKSIEDGPQQQVRVNAAYERATGPIKFEAGAQWDGSFAEQDFSSLDFDSAQQQYVSNAAFSNFAEYDNRISSVYGILSGKVRAFSWQAGLRGEHFAREIDVDSGSYRDRWYALYPSIHLSQEVNESLQLTASYSRRVERPRNWYLDPFVVRVDPYNVRVGNPKLKPEYIDSYEGGTQIRAGNWTITSELYYRITHQKVERVRSVYSESVALQSVENIGTDYSLGNETMLSTELTRKIALQLIGNAYRYEVKGSLFGNSFRRRSNNWTTRTNATVKPSARTQIQIDGNYDSPTVSSQGRREGFFTLNASLRYEFIPRTLSATLQVRDVLGTAKFEDTSSGPGFSNYRYSVREAPVFLLNVRYVFNNYKAERGRERRRDSDSEEEDF